MSLAEAAACAWSAGANARTAATTPPIVRFNMRSSDESFLARYGPSLRNITATKQPFHRRSSAALASGTVPDKSSGMNPPKRRSIAGLILLLVAVVSPRLDAQQATIASTYSPIADSIYRAATGDSLAYIRLGRLVDTFGHRLSGSPSLEAAIDWILAEMTKDGLEKVRGEPVMVPRWVRGTESVEMVQPRVAPLRMLGLGAASARRRMASPLRFSWCRASMSCSSAPPTPRARSSSSTRRSPITSPSAGSAPMVLGCRARRALSPASFARWHRPPSAALTPAHSDTTPPSAKIPAAALSVEDAMMLHRFQNRGERVIVTLRMSARTLPDAPSRNVVAEVVGREKPDEVVVLGGHIDSWDVGQGAMDDGGGAVAAWEAVRLLHRLGLRPRRTVRVVLWTNEENGGRGARAYHDAHAAEIAGHVLAMESDNGVFNPKGYTFVGSDAAANVVKQVASLLDSVGIAGVQRVPESPAADITPSGGSRRARDGAGCGRQPVLLVPPQRRRHPRQARSRAGSPLCGGHGRDGLRRGRPRRSIAAQHGELNLRQPHSMMRPSRAALTAASARVDTSSLEKMEATWDLTVWSEIPSRPAITLFPSPSANIASTSISRGVSG